VVAPRGRGEELLRDGVNALLTGPGPPELADALDRLGRDRTLAEELGRGARASAARHRLGWEHVVAKLVA